MGMGMKVNLAGMGMSDVDVKSNRAWEKLLMKQTKLASAANELKSDSNSSTPAVSPTTQSSPSSKSAWMKLIQHSNNNMNNNNNNSNNND